ncbi:DUF5054 domain-containing protein [Phycisphaera mikurensis]|uniref:Glycoside hydrolase family 38 N-terminal domain-containing protein n=1 Tax=Phycisphaera mikurensis (strain NBRC 102666 / KCTC 22515 / FYK2301M01) TaxID=1142394 RepID=I0ICS6_PHYMF|nr:DUF5054 domain-containing protein [Phycisphaera mikurensis]MBB6443315.1 hypothetical protein [Phycisphaera mikurensis]BAM03064.1 hypothetical protein PSMK_09050 [Phycisphaera mikurensis NBRC 102666]
MTASTAQFVTEAERAADDRRTFPAVRRLVVGFKTHLDIGFTDHAHRVVDHYLQRLVPSVLDTVERTRDGVLPMCWTTGSWLIERALDPSRGMANPNRRRLEEAIAAGGIVWHALPFTTHTALLDVPLLEAAVGVSRRLDARFGRRTIAAKMTDVPGHPRGLVGPLAGFGIELLHLGVNPGTPLPEVPARFRWRDSRSRELTVVYADDYAREVVSADGSEAFVLVHAGDNQPAPDAAGVAAAAAALQRRFPNAQLAAGGLDDLAAMLRGERSTLPVVTAEIGDSWSHGVATDPPHLARHRGLLRRRDRVPPVHRQAFDELLLLAAEHTRGMDEKIHLADYRSYRPADFDAARAADAVPDEAVPAELAAMNAEIGPAPSRRFSSFEASWEEQRAYLHAAAALLPEGLNDGPAPGGGAIDLQALGLAVVVRYEVFDSQSIARFNAAYNRNWHQAWVVADFSKPGLELVDADAPARAWEVRFDRAGEAAFGCGDHPAARPPAAVELAVDGGRLTVTLREKPENRWPEATWIGLVAADEKAPRVTVDILGEPVDLAGVVRHGGRLHPVGAWVDAAWPDRTLRVHPLDTPLLTTDPRLLLDLAPGPPGPAPGLWFNVHNNLWGTNFPMWAGGTWTARFDVEAATPDRSAGRLGF